MTTYKILQIIVLSYSSIVAIFALFSIVFEVRNNFRPVRAKVEFFSFLNRLHGKYIILNVFRVFSVVFMCAWLVLALPWADSFTGIHKLTSMEYNEHFQVVFSTYLGDFIGKQGDYYFITVFVTILGVKGFWVVKRMADILRKDTLAVGMTGMWGARKDFRTLQEN